MNQNECQRRIMYNADRLMKVSATKNFMGPEAQAIEDTAKSLYSMAHEGSILLSDLPGMNMTAVSRLKDILDQRIANDDYEPGDKGIQMVLQGMIDKAASSKIMRGMVP